MKCLLLFLLFNASLAMAQDELIVMARENIAQSFHDGSVSKKLNDRFDKTEIGGNPLLNGYKGAFIMAKGKHAVNPFKKLGYFNDGKAMLEAAIETDLENIELRFLRLTMQVNIPSFLGYNENRKADRDFIKQNLHKLESEELKKKISEFIENAEAEGKI